MHDPSYPTPQDVPPPPSTSSAAPPIGTTVSVNQHPHPLTGPPGTSLLSWLRQIGEANVHRVCATGDCGACTVWVDEVPIHSCLYPARRAAGRAITTIAGLAPTGQLNPTQQAFIDHQGFQCGFCTAGMVMSAAHLNCASEAELRRALRGNLCRCTGYEAIVESILAQGRTEAKQTPQPSEGLPCAANDPGPAAASPIGQNVPKQDGYDIVTGQPVYTADWTPPGVLHLKVLRSPHPHARIRQINTAPARALPGVHAILTHADVPRRAYTTAGHAAPVPDPIDHYLLDDKVRFIGDRVAAVVADTVAIATAACQLIEVEYEILPSVVDPFLAMSGDPTVPIIHDEPDSSQIYDASRNLAAQVTLTTGDIEQGFAAADWIVEQTYHLPPVQHAHLEPHTTISWLTETGGLVVRSATQVPFHIQRLLSEIFELPIDQIRVFKAKLGGGFGNKQDIVSEDLCVLATLKTGRPVQWEFTREEEFTATNSRHAMVMRLKTGVKADGTLVAQDLEVVANTGAYGNHSSTVIFLAGYIPLALYPCPNRRFVGYGVYTNTMPAGAFRGYGATQGTFALESQMDMIAARLGIDPIAYRRQHMLGPTDQVSLGPSDDHFTLIGSYTLSACLDYVATALQPAPPAHPSSRRGIGFALSMQGSGLSKIHTAGVRLTLEPNGRFCLRTGAVDLGTGAETTLRQVAAAVLGVTVPDIDLICSDTQTTPFDAGAYASGTMYISGQAVNLAAQQLRTQLLECAAPILQRQVADLTLANGLIGDGQISLTLQALATQMSEQNRGVGGETAIAASPLTVELMHTADQSSLTFVAQGVEVEVDTETGQVTLLRSVQALDLGIAINPRICRGQAMGGSVMGIGYALMEELLVNDRGQVLNPTFRTYRIPTAADVPPLEVKLVESVDPYGPFGAKGVGEVTTNAIAPAIANAIANAIGIRLTQLPMTPERVLRAIQAHQSSESSVI